jgi:glycerol-3-phosphate acyltransferase PlsX
VSARVRVALDAMGGDNAPQAAIAGAAAALSAYPEIAVALVGKSDVVKSALSGHSADMGRIEIIHASEVIGADESPTAAVRRKKDSSIAVGLRLLKEDSADAFVSAGSTGALLTGAAVTLDRLPGVARPALATLLPTKTGGRVLLLDSGANVDAKPEYLAQFAAMGSVYMERAEGVSNPRVGLINIGAEAEKGNALTRAAYGLLAALPGINFIGNAEPRDIPAGVCDVAVCDAFVGNVILKYSEGLAGALMSMLKRELMATLPSKIGAALSKGAYKRLARAFDYEEVGGAPFLGLTKVVVKAHGSSGEKAFKNALGQALRFASSGAAGGLAAKLAERQ